MSESDDLFAHARAHEAELTDRQRDVLRMVAAGRTNAEIADTLGISFAGAKWHVAEVYSKLGLASREEAAAYWHWRTGFRGRRAAFARVFAPAAWWRFAAGGGLLAGVVLAAFLFLRDGDEAPFELGPYTATVQYSTPGSEGMREAIRYADGRHWSLVFYDFTGKLGGYTYADGAVLAIYLDGRDAVASDFISHHYSERPIPGPLGARIQPPLTNGDALLVGRVIAPDIDQTLEVLREEWRPSGGEVRRVKNEKVLGREAATFEATSAKGLVTRIWVDLESGIVLRLEEPMRDTLLVGEVIELDTTLELDGATFTYTMPVGTTPPTPGEGQLRAGPPGSRIGLPGLYLTPVAGPNPTPFELRSVVYALDESGRINSEYGIRGLPDARVVIEQRPLPGVEMRFIEPGFSMDYPGIESSLWGAGEDRFQAALWTNATLAEVNANGVDRDELVAWLASFAIVEPEP